MKAQIDILKDALTPHLDGMLKRASSSGIRAYLSRVVYKQYQDAQIERWNTENRSEGPRWKRLNPAYEKSKRKRFAKYPYGGTKMLVATGRLLKSVVGTDRRYHRRVVLHYAMEILVTLPYAPNVNAERNFTQFGQRTKREILGGLKRHILGK